MTSDQNSAKAQERNFINFINNKLSQISVEVYCINISKVSSQNTYAILKASNCSRSEWIRPYPFNDGPGTRTKELGLLAKQLRCFAFWLSLSWLDLGSSLFRVNLEFQEKTPLHTEEEIGTLRPEHAALLLSRGQGRFKTPSCERLGSGSIRVSSLKFHVAVHAFIKIASDT